MLPVQSLEIRTFLVRPYGVYVSLKAAASGGEGGGGGGEESREKGRIELSPERELIKKVGQGSESI